MQRSETARHVTHFSKRPLVRTNITQILCKVVKKGCLKTKKDQKTRLRDLRKEKVKNSWEGLAKLTDEGVKTFQNLGKGRR